MSFAPDIAGFIAAQDELRTNLGSSVTFRTPIAPAWPAGTKINPDTGEPYSPMVKRTNAEFTEQTVQALIIVKQGSPMRPQADTQVEEVGLLPGMDIILDVDDEAKALVGDASQFVVNGQDFKVEEWKPFSVKDQVYRHLVYGQEL